MTRRVTTRFPEPVLKLIAEKASNEKKSISETIAELAADSILSDGNDKIGLGLLEKTFADLSKYIRNDFRTHDATLQRGFRMLLSLLIITDEIAKHFLPAADYEAAWVKIEKKQKEYAATNHLSI